MVYLVIIIATLAGVVSSLVFWSMYMAEKAKVEPLQKALAAAEKSQNNATIHALDQQERLEAVIVGLKKEVATIEATMSVCRDPAVVRDRLRQLLGATEAGLPSAGTPGAYGAMPYGGTPKT